MGVSRQHSAESVRSAPTWATRARHGSYAGIVQSLAGVLASPMRYVKAANSRRRPARNRCSGSCSVKASAFS